MKQLNPLQKLIDEFYQDKLLHSELAQNAENERQSVENGYADFLKGVVRGLELVIEKVAKFQFWNDARTNPPKFDENRECPNCPPFACVVKYDNGEYNLDRCYYNFEMNKWEVGIRCQVVFWQEYSILPKEVLEWEFR